MWFSSPSQLIAAIWEGKRKDKLLRRISQPDDNRAAFAPVVVVLCVGFAALMLAVSAVIHALS